MKNKDDYSTFWAGWIVWAILFFLTVGSAWLFNHSILPPSYTVSYSDSSSRHESISLLSSLALFYVVGWPLFGWITLDK